MTRDVKLSPIEINASHFRDCIARLGGAIRLDQLSHKNMIVNTGFEGCIAVAYKDGGEMQAGFGGGAIFSHITDIECNFFGDGCSLIKSTLNLGTIIYQQQQQQQQQQQRNQSISLPENSFLAQTMDKYEVRIFLKIGPASGWMMVVDKPRAEIFGGLVLYGTNINGIDEESWWQDY